MRLTQWHDVVVHLRTQAPSRGLRRRIEQWLLATDSDVRPTQSIDLATAALQAERALLGEDLAPVDRVAGLLGLGLAEDVLAHRERGGSTRAIWQPTFEMLARRLAWMIASRPEETRLARERLGIQADEIIAPILDRLRSWMEAGLSCSSVALGRAPGLFVLENRLQGETADVCVLVEEGALGHEGITVQGRFGRGTDDVPIGRDGAGAMRLGALLGLIAGEVRAGAPLSPAVQAKRWQTAVKGLGLGDEAGLDPASLNHAVQAASRVSARCRTLFQAGTRIEVAFGLGGLPALDGISLAAAVAGATARAVQNGTAAKLSWDTALTGGLSGDGRLLPVLGLSGKTRACVQSRMVALVGPAANGSALRELEVGLDRKTPLQIHAATDLLSALQFEPVRPGAARRRSTRFRVAASILAGAVGILGLLGVSGLLSTKHAPPVAVRTTALVTWPSEERGARISPDGRCVLFLSDRLGIPTLWVGAIAGPDFREFTTVADGTVMSAVWSPDGTQVAMLMEGDSGPELQIRPASGRGIDLKAPVSLKAPVLLRWRKGGIYVQSGYESMWRLTPPDLRPVPLLQNLPVKILDWVDVSVDERQFVFGAKDSKRRNNLWNVRASDGTLSRLTEDEEPQRMPKWLGASGERIGYVAQASGASNVWSMAVGDKTASQLTFNEADEFLEDISADGQTLLIQKKEQRSNLWELNLDSLRSTHLTSDRRGDSWASATGDGRIIAFQRDKPRRDKGNTFDTQILELALFPTKSLAPEVVLPDGFWPVLSPNGKWLAYIRLPGGVVGGTGRPEIWVLERGRGAKLVPKSFLLSAITTQPFEKVGLNLIWTRDSESIIFVARSEDRKPQLCRYRPSRPQDEVEVFDIGSGELDEFMDPVISPNDSTVAWLDVSSDGRRMKIRTHSFAESEVQTVGAVFQIPKGEGFALRGWVDSERLLLIHHRYQDNAWQVQPLSIDLRGNSEKLGEPRMGSPDSVRFDTRSDTLYMTGLDEGVQNIYSLSLGQKLWTRLTDNRFPGTAYSGLEVLPNDRLVYSNESYVRDIWRVDLRN